MDSSPIALHIEHITSGTFWRFTNQTLLRVPDHSYRFSCSKTLIVKIFSVASLREENVKPFGKKKIWQASLIFSTDPVHGNTSHDTEEWR
jgi:hypothetical protein